MLRLSVAHTVIAMVVIDVDNIQMAPSEETASIFIDSLDDRFPTKDLGKLSWYMENEYARDREKSTLEILYMKFIRNVLHCFKVTITSLLPASPSLERKEVNEEETLVDVPFRDVAESRMWIANQTRTEISKAVRGAERYSHEPKGIH